MRLISLCLLLCLPALAADHPDFTGNWVLDTNKSHFGNMPKPVGMKLTVTKNGEAYHSVEVTDTAQGPTTAEGDWFLDGKSHPADKMSQMSKWENSTLYAEKKSDDGAYDQVIRLTLSPDGKTATERIKVKSPNGNNSSTLVWLRQ
jgi:hypothetical protein